MPLESIVPNASADAVELLNELLYWNPNRRPTCSQSLRSSYFRVNQKLGAQQISNSSAVSKSLHRAQQQQHITTNTHNQTTAHQQQLVNFASNTTTVHNNQQPASERTAPSDKHQQHQSNGGLKRSSFYSDSNLVSINAVRPSATTISDNNNDDGEQSASESTNSQVTRHNRLSSHSLIRSGFSAKDQYLSRARYVAGQTTAKANYRAPGE